MNENHPTSLLRFTMVPTFLAIIRCRLSRICQHSPSKISRNNLLKSKCHSLSDLMLPVYNSFRPRGVFEALQIGTNRQYIPAYLTNEVYRTREVRHHWEPEHLSPVNSVRIHFWNEGVSHSVRTKLVRGIVQNHWLFTVAHYFSQSLWNWVARGTSHRFSLAR